MFTFKISIFALTMGSFITFLQAILSPIYKKGEKYEPDTYTPVSLTCICCKSLEHILISRFIPYLSDHKMLVEAQHGFRSGRSCETQLVQFIHDLLENLDGVHYGGHKQTDLIIMDIAKAFDKIPHSVTLVQKVNNSLYILISY